MMSSSVMHAFIILSATIVAASAGYSAVSSGNGVGDSYGFGGSFSGTGVPPNFPPIPNFDFSSLLGQYFNQIKSYNDAIASNSVEHDTPLYILKGLNIKKHVKRTIRSKRSSGGYSNGQYPQVATSSTRNGGIGVGIGDDYAFSYSSDGQRDRHSVISSNPHRDPKISISTSENGGLGIGIGEQYANSYSNGRSRDYRSASYGPRDEKRSISNSDKGGIGIGVGDRDAYSFSSNGNNPRRGDGYYRGFNNGYGIHAAASGGPGGSGFASIGFPGIPNAAGGVGGGGSGFGFASGGQGASSFSSGSPDYGSYGGGFGGNFQSGAPGNGAYAGASLGPGGGYQTAAIYPENPGNPNIVNRFSDAGAPNQGGFYGVFSSSHSSSSDADGQRKQHHEAQTTINDNGKVTTYRVKN